MLILLFSIIVFIALFIVSILTQNIYSSTLTWPVFGMAVYLGDTIFVVSPYLCITYTQILNCFRNLDSVTFLAVIIGFQGALIGAAIPLALQIINRSNQELGNLEFAKDFIGEGRYKWLKRMLIYNIAISFVIVLLKIKHPIIMIIMLMWVIINIYMFYLFWKMVENYATNIDEIYQKRFKEKIDEYIS